MKELVELLERAIHDRGHRLEHVKRFQRLVWDSEDLHPDPEIANLLRELALDLSYFEPDERVRREDPSYYGDARLEEEIRSVLRKLPS